DMPQKLTVEEFLAYLRPFYPTWDKELEKSILSQLRLPLDRKICDLSHGMRMKMSLACALPFRPKLLVLDEPFSGLDPLVRDEFVAAPFPKGWVRVRSVGNVLSFVDTQFSEGNVGERLRALVGNVRTVDAQPMALRSIFTTLARAAREGALP